MLKYFVTSYVRLVGRLRGMLYFLHGTSVLSFYTYVVLTLSITHVAYIYAGLEGEERQSHIAIDVISQTGYIAVDDELNLSTRTPYVYRLLAQTKLLNYRFCCGRSFHDDPHVVIMSWHGCIETPI